MTLHTKQSRLKTGSVAVAVAASALTEKGQRRKEGEREGGRWRNTKPDRREREGTVRLKLDQVSYPM